MSYTYRATLEWSPSNNADLDLYTRLDSHVIWFANESGGGLELNHDAHPLCLDDPLSPEIIEGAFDAENTFGAWYDQYSNCAAEQVPGVRKVEVINTGETSIYVNGEELPPGQTAEISPIAYAGYNTGGSPDFTDATEIKVTRHA